MIWPFSISLNGSVYKPLWPGLYPEIYLSVLRVTVVLFFEISCLLTWGQLQLSLHSKTYSNPFYSHRHTFNNCNCNWHSINSIVVAWRDKNHGTSEHSYSCWKYLSDLVSGFTNSSFPSFMFSTPPESQAELIKNENKFEQILRTFASQQTAGYWSPWTCAMMFHCFV